MAKEVTDIGAPENKITALFARLRAAHPDRRRIDPRIVIRRPVR